MIIPSTYRVTWSLCKPRLTVQAHQLAVYCTILSTVVSRVDQDIESGKASPVQQHKIRTLILS